MLVVPCALLVLSGVAMARTGPGHGDGHGSSGCWDWRRPRSGCLSPAFPTRPPSKPPSKPPAKPRPTTTSTSTTSSTTSTTLPSVTSATIPESPAGASGDVPAAAPTLAASARTVGSSASRRPAARPVTAIVAAPVLPGLPEAVPALEQPSLPPPASFQDDVLLPGSIALVIAVAGLATAFLVYQGAAGRRGPRGPTGPVDDGETLEFR